MDNSSYIEALVNFESDIQKIFGSPSPNCSVEMDSPVPISGSSSSDSEEKQPLTVIRKKRNTKTRRPAYRPEYMPGLRILKTDIRRRYGEMYVNVTNSQDPKLVQEFFFKFCLPSCYYDEKFGEECKFGEFVRSVFSRGHESRLMRKAGLAEIVQGCIASRSIFPDGCLRLLNFEVRVTRGVSGSQLVAKVMFKGTLLYDVIRTPRKLELADSDGHQYPLPSPIIEISGPNHSSENVYLALKKEPVQVKVFYKLVMQLDDSNHICSFHISPITSD